MLTEIHINKKSVFYMIIVYKVRWKFIMWKLALIYSLDSGENCNRLPGLLTRSVLRNVGICANPRWTSNWNTRALMKGSSFFSLIRLFFDKVVRLGIELTRAPSLWWVHFTTDRANVICTAQPWISGSLISWISNRTTTSKNPS